MEKYSLRIFLLAALLSPGYAEGPCDLHMSVNVTGGAFLENGSVVHDGLVYLPGQYYEETYENGSKQTRGCICSVKPCMRKCCPTGEAMVGKNCTRSEEPLVNPFSPKIYSLDRELPEMKASDHFGLVYGNPCVDGNRYPLDPDVPDSLDTYYLQQDGYLYIPQHPVITNYSQMFYCMDVFPHDPEGDPNSGWTTKHLVLLCFGPGEDEAASEDDVIFSLFPIGMIISIPFLLATFFVYAIIPELRNLHGKALMSYVTGLIVGYSFLAAIQIKTTRGSNNMSTSTCLFMAFTIYFFFMVSFFWLNVMCFDIWWTFSGFRAPRQGRRVAERRRFLLYCLYAWGAPLVLTGVLALMQFHTGIPRHHVRPQFGTDKCWFYEWKAELVYFYMPVIILVVCNLALFASTTWKILQINRETAMLKTGDNSRHDQYSKDKQRFNLYLKLFLVMGINWVAEWVSFMIGGSKYLWILTDFSNTMLGLFIFIIFVWKKKIKNLLIKRYHLLRYGSTASRERTSSRFRSTNATSTSGLETERSFLSQDESAIRLSQLK